jgi:hypothetical protein
MNLKDSAQWRNEIVILAVALVAIYGAASAVAGSTQDAFIEENTVTMDKVMPVFDIKPSDAVDRNAPEQIPARSI